MYKVKFFREMSTAKLEDSINNFLSNQTDKFTLLDVKYVYNENNSKNMFTALVTYSIK